MRLRIFPLFKIVSFLLFFVLSLSVSAQADEAWNRVMRTKELRWGGDAAGGAPYVFPNSRKPSEMVGFEVEILEALSRQLNVRPVFVNVPWDQLVPALMRGDFDMAFNGLEVTKDRLAVIDFSIPYYFFSEQLTVRNDDNAIREFSDLPGRRVGTLSASLAKNILEQDGRIEVISYPSPVEVYRDLDIGRLDAALMDIPIAAYYATLNPKLKNVGKSVGDGIYAGGIRKDAPLLKAKINQALIAIIRSGELERIYRKWYMWNKDQGKLSQAATRYSQNVEGKKSLWKFTGLLLKGAGMTVILSLLAMMLAVVAGSMLCVGKLYGNVWVRFFCHAYIEIIRGTPLLIQLYLLYYGLPNLGIQLSAFVAAVLGLGLNYAAYEAEIYRAGLLSIAKGQDEASRSLGMTGWQSLKYVIAPQAIRTILPPSTNDFIALFKDTSLVSIITVTELTRAYSQAATTTYRFLELGLATALLYFLMSFPLSLWSRSMEKKRHAAFH